MIHGWHVIVAAAMSAFPDLLPPVQSFEARDGAFVLPDNVVVQAPQAWADLVGGYLWVIDETLRARGPYRVRLAPDGPAIRIVASADPSLPHEGYVLDVGAGGIVIAAREPGGAFNALATLSQMIEQSPGPPVRLPACSIRDGPAVAVRAAHIDLTCQQYTPAYLRRLMRTLARYKVNAILMEYSDLFPFRRHRDICRPDALSEQDIVDLRRTARQGNQEIIPFLQCLGHLEYVLHRPAYERYGAAHHRYMYCPASEDTLPLVRELIDEVLAQHPESRRLHVGGDEVSPDRGGPCPRCEAVARRDGFSSLYVRHYGPVAEYCQRRGVTPLMWSDMMLQYPEAIAQMPRNVAWVVWDYGTTTDPAPSLFHGAAMGRLDAVSPAYRRYFGRAAGIEDAQDRGGLIAFGHAAGFRSLGFEAFTAPAARCAGDNFNLPRFDLHMRNIRMACLKAADFSLPGAILTSWSYRGSPHEVCLPEYVCMAYGWNPAAPDVEALLSAFLRQRYGLDEPALAAALFATTPIVPPSTRAMPECDDARRAWVVSGRRQLEQVRQAAGANLEANLAACRTWLAQLTATADLVRQAGPTAARNRGELRHWELSMEHLIGRLGIAEPLLRLAGVAYAGAQATDEQVAAWTGQLRQSEPARERLRPAWADLYRDLWTPAHLAVELYNRFDAEREMIHILLADVAGRHPPTRPAPSS